MTVRDATPADISAIVRCRNDTATSLPALNIQPWTDVQVANILDNIAAGRGRFRLRVCELGLPRRREVAGFLLTKFHPPPESDGREQTIELIASRIEGTPIRDRLRLRVVALQTIRDLVGYCYSNGRVWRAFTVDDPADRFAINEIIANRGLIAEGVDVEIVERNGIAWRVIRSADPVRDPATLTWPDDTVLEVV